jgi:hypothetical protein
MTLRLLPGTRYQAIGPGGTLWQARLRMTGERVWVPLPASAAHLRRHGYRLPWV